MTRARSYRAALLGGLALALLGCAPSTPVYTLPDPAPQASVQRSAQSEALARYYTDLQRDLARRGLLRQDDGREIAVSSRILARNFEAVALRDEYTAGSTGFVRRETASLLRRWEKPVRLQVSFGATVPETIRQADARFVDSFAARLQRVSGHSITVSDRDPNYLVLVIGQDDHAAAIREMAAFVPGLTPDVAASYMAFPRSMLCLVYGFSSGAGSSNYDRAVAIIRAEHPTVLRQSCLQEEITQGLGLANDSPHARPSIFNDDEEFAFLTAHDEKLLRILYDPRLRTGMSADQARPIIQQIASELSG